jgi:pimeloyl-ACP methyl ester carboxylesterase
LPIVLLVLLSIACQAPTGPEPIVSGDGFFDAPWPSDARTTDGHPDLEGFFAERARGDDLFSVYQALGEQVTGFATNPTVYFRFDGAIDGSLLPSPRNSATVDSPIFLVDVDPRSERRGERVPIAVDFTTAATTFQPEHLLAVQPVFGFTLQPRTTYAVVVTTEIAARSREFADVWRDSELYVPLAEVLFDERATGDVAVATVFTTGDPTAEVAMIAATIHDRMRPPLLDQEVQVAYRGDRYTAYQGTMLVPNWQNGTKPYGTAGGGFRFEDGEPVIAEWERTRFTLSVPNAAPPPDGWPVAIVAHGTGGDDAGFADDPDESREPANVLARAGIAGIGISQPLHGDRWSGDDVSTYVFNYVNPESGITSFRQGALDVVYLAELLAQAPQTFTARDESMTLDPTRIAFLGHSQGGMTGAIAAPFFAERVRGIMLSGAGGNTTLAVIHRKEGGLDIQAMLGSLLGIDADEELDAFHPVCAFLQFLSEPADPINYAAYWSREAPWWESTPQDVMMTEGLLDIHTPPEAAETLAVAGGLPILDPVGQFSDGAALRDLVGGGPSARGNLTAWDGGRVTGGLTQFADEDHFAIYMDDEAVSLYQGFLATAVEDDVAEIPPRD